MAGHVVKYGKHHERRSFARISEVLELPNLIEIQTDSCQWFLDEGLGEMFEDILLIDDFNGNPSLEFVDYELKEPKYTVAEARAHDASYSAPLHVTLRLTNRETGEIKAQEVFFGDFPLMTERGIFIINGAERVIVSQLVRSPGVYFHGKVDKNGKEGLGSTVIPNRGAWLEMETDAKDISYVRIDRTRKIPLTVLVRALGFGSDDAILEIFGDSEALRNTVEKDLHKNASDSRTEEGLKDAYERLRPGEPETTDSSRDLLNTRFFGPKHYDLADAGRYRVNKKLDLKTCLLNLTLAKTLTDPGTGEIIVEKGTVLTHQVMETLVPFIGDGLNSVTYYPSEDGVVTDPMTVQVIKVFSPKDLEREVNVIGNDYPEAAVKTVRPADIVASMSYFLNLMEGIGNVDDINHLGNRRTCSVDELLQNQFHIGLARMERVVRERTSIQDTETLTPQQLINIRPVVASIKELSGSSQLSQFMDQTNPLGELIHRHRLSALGPGGLARDRAGYEVRDVHYFHYGRMCPIKTSEGPNIGLINSLSSYARINKFGFIETPYRRVDHKTGRVTDQIDYLTADIEDHYIIAQANSPLNEDETFVQDVVVARAQSENLEVSIDKVDYMDISPKQVVTVTIACIPFLENDDSNRVLMGADMQRQAVPLINPQAPWVGTGMEYRSAHDLGTTLLCKHDGVVEYVDVSEIRVRRDNGALDKYDVTKFRRSNPGTSYNQRSIVHLGEKVEKGDTLADRPPMEQGEMALGQNVLVGFMTWEGYNYEDAIIISRRLVKDGVRTSIHTEEYESEVRDTKLGPEEITREIPSVGEDALKDLDEMGIIRISAEVQDGDLLVGKVTPKEVTELSAEERLLRAIFGEKAREVRDTSLRVPYGGGGIIHDVKILTREVGDKLSPGINILVHVYIVQKRKIHEGDRMAGRRENKGVVSRIMPEEDMSSLPDETPTDIMLNPLGVPSRMNIGRVLELHLDMAARQLGIHVATPVFDGASGEDVWETAREAGMASGAKTALYDGRTGEPFDGRVSVGVMYMIKLAHMADDKLHTRLIGPYSLVTQQPLGGRAQFGGQRSSGMEVWALGAYGAAYILQETLTYKPDDVVGCVETYEAIVKGEPVPKPGVLESFRVLVKELQSLGLDMRVLDIEETEIEPRDMDDGDDDPITVDALTKFTEQQTAKELEKKTARQVEDERDDVIQDFETAEDSLD